MPRQPDGSFLRYNSQFYGADVWQQDLETDIKIIALRHDTHDEDIAEGISQCLPKDGAEPMLGSLNMGGFQIGNLLNGALATDGASFGQTITNATWNGTAEQLTLVRAGMSDIVVTIPVGGGTGAPLLTGVQSIIAGSGLQFANGNSMSTANPDDTISLENSGVAAGSYVNPNVTVDEKGRITSISSGNVSGTNLGVSNKTDSTLDVTSSTGSSATLPPVVADTSAGLMTGTMAKQLADLVAAGAGGMKPPIELIGVDDDRKEDYRWAALQFSELYNTFTDTNWTPVVSHTGSGIISFLGSSIAGTPPATVDLRLLIDGVVVWSKDTAYIGSTPADEGFDIIGATDIVGLIAAAFDMVTFNSSFSFEAKLDSGSANMSAHIKYQKFS